MSGKHTPGPWIVDANCGRDEHEVEIKLERGGWFLVVGAGYPFEKMADPFDAKAEFEANAHLIAAAPDLLEALKLLVKQRARKAGTVEGSLHLWDEASAAILKATGAA